MLEGCSFKKAYALDVWYFHFLLEYALDTEKKDAELLRRDSDN